MKTIILIVYMLSLSLFAHAQMSYNVDIQAVQSWQQFQKIQELNATEILYTNNRAIKTKFNAFFDKHQFNLAASFQYQKLYQPCSFIGVPLFVNRQGFFIKVPSDYIIVGLEIGKSWQYKEKNKFNVFLSPNMSFIFNDTIKSGIGNFTAFGWGSQRVEYQRTDITNQKIGFGLYFGVEYKYKLNNYISLLAELGSNVGLRQTQLSWFDYQFYDKNTGVINALLEQEISFSGTTFNCALGCSFNF